MKGSAAIVLTLLSIMSSAVAASQDREWVAGHLSIKYGEWIEKPDETKEWQPIISYVGYDKSGNTVFLTAGEAIVLGNEGVSSIVNKIKPGDKKYYRYGRKLILWKLWKSISWI